MSVTTILLTQSFLSYLLPYILHQTRVTDHSATVIIYFQITHLMSPSVGT